MLSTYFVLNADSVSHIHLYIECGTQPQKGGKQVLGKQLTALLISQSLAHSMLVASGEIREGRGREGVWYFHTQQSCCGKLISTSSVYMVLHSQYWLK